MFFFSASFPRSFTLCLFAFIAALIPVGAIRTAYAATITPAIIEREVAPGNEVSGSIMLANDSDGPVVYYPFIQNFVAEGEDGQQRFFPETERNGLAAWLDVSSDPIRIGPGKKSEIHWAVKIPKSAGAGGYDAVIFFSTAPPKNDGVSVGMRIGALFLLDVKGDAMHAAQLESFRATSKTSIGSIFGQPVFDRLPVAFETRIRDQGSTHLRPNGEIRIRDLFGREVSVLNVNPNSVRVLPHSIRRMVSEWTPGGFAFGGYSAVVTLAYGQPAQPFTNTIFFWVFPWKTCLLGFGALVILIGLIAGYTHIRRVWHA